jgi:DNA excision repair protein ERCC-1
MVNYIKSVKMIYKDEMNPDFIIGKYCCVLFISLKFHSLKKDYLKERIKQLGNLFSLRVVLCKIDCDDFETSLETMNELCYLGDCTLILCWSDQEAAKYIEIYKLYENKSATLIQTKIENEYIPRVSFLFCLNSKLQDTLGAIRSVNKTDSITLATNFGVKFAPFHHFSL